MAWFSVLASVLVSALELLSSSGSILRTGKAIVSPGSGQSRLNFLRFSIARRVLKNSERRSAVKSSY